MTTQPPIHVRKMLMTHIMIMMILWKWLLRVAAHRSCHPSRVWVFLKLSIQLVTSLPVATSATRGFQTVRVSTTQPAAKQLMVCRPVSRLQAAYAQAADDTLLTSPRSSDRRGSQAGTQLTSRLPSDRSGSQTGVQPAGDSDGVSDGARDLSDRI